MYMKYKIKKNNCQENIQIQILVLTKFYTMMTSSNGNIFRVTGPLCGEFTGPGEFPAQRPVTRSFDVFFDLRLNKRLSKQPWGWWFETPAWSLWRHRNAKPSMFTWHVSINTATLRCCQSGQALLSTSRSRVGGARFKPVDCRLPTLPIRRAQTEWLLDMIINWRFASLKSFVRLWLWCMFALSLLNPINTLRPRQNERHFADDIFNCILLNENVWWNLIKISLKFVPKGPINNIPSLVQIMACRLVGTKPFTDADYWRIYESLGLRELKEINNMYLYVFYKRVFCDENFIEPIYLHLDVWFISPEISEKLINKSKF